jgi:hypothetical protein
MASSYNTIGLELMATGENAGTWGSKTNNNLDLIQQAVAGYEAVTITDSTTTALAISNGTLSNARNMVIKIATITLTGATTVTIPDGVEKFYIFDLTAVTGVTNLTIKTASGTGFTAGEAKIVAAYSDGTNLNEIALNTLGGTIGSAQIDDNAITSAKISANQVTTAKIADNAITTAKISALQVTADKIANSTITAAKLATDSVGPDQLISTGVTAGSYTVASITVDADGRITTASSGSAGANSYVATFARYSPSVSPGTGTFTANPTTTKVAAFMRAGGGTGAPAGSGGYGGSGIWYTTITQPFSTPYVVGGGATYPPFSAGTPTTLTGVGTATGGGTVPNPGGSPSPVNKGAPGTASGATIDLSAPVTPGAAYDQDKGYTNFGGGEDLASYSPTKYFGQGGGQANPFPSNGGFLIIMEDILP